MDAPSTLDILRAVFRLEAERTLLLARLGRVAGAEVQLEDVDGRLDEALSALDERGVTYACHMLARRYRLSQADYLILQLALLPRQGADVIAEVTDLLGDQSSLPRMSHALALVAEGFDDWERARAELETLPVFRERLVIADDPTAEDPNLRPSLAVLELLGLE
jgi:hypothetical protein